MNNYLLITRRNQLYEIIATTAGPESHRVPRYPIFDPRVDSDTDLDIKIYPDIVDRASQVMRACRAMPRDLRDMVLVHVIIDLLVYRRIQDAAYLIFSSRYLLNTFYAYFVGTRASISVKIRLLSSTLLMIFEIYTTNICQLNLDRTRHQMFHIKRPARDAYVKATYIHDFYSESELHTYESLDGTTEEYSTLCIEPCETDKPQILGLEYRDWISTNTGPTNADITWILGDIDWDTLIIRPHQVYRPVIALHLENCSDTPVAQPAFSEEEIRRQPEIQKLGRLVKLVFGPQTGFFITCQDDGMRDQYTFVQV